MNLARTGKEVNTIRRNTNLIAFSTYSIAVHRNELEFVECPEFVISLTWHYTLGQLLVQVCVWAKSTLFLVLPRHVCKHVYDLNFAKTHGVVWHKMSLDGVSWTHHWLSCLPGTSPRIMILNWRTIYVKNMIRKSKIRCRSTCLDYHRNSQGLGVFMCVEIWNCTLRREQNYCHNKAWCWQCYIAAEQPSNCTHHLFLQLTIALWEKRRIKHGFDWKLKLLPMWTNDPLHCIWRGTSTLSFEEGKGPICIIEAAYQNRDCQPILAHMHPFFPAEAAGKGTRETYAAKFVISAWLHH